MKRYAILLALALIVFSAASASAHATVVDCDPSIGANLADPPAQLVCHFSERLAASGNTLVVRDAQNVEVNRGDTAFYQGDATRLVVTLDTSRMGTGIYTVRWSVTSAADNGVTQDTLQFGVRAAVPPTPTPILPGAPYDPNAPRTSDLLARLLIGAGVILLGAIGFLFWRMRGESKSNEQDV